jgi:uncharacterized protein YegL
MTRRLPLYLLLDTSGSMAGEPIEAVNAGLRSFIAALRRDVFALETVHLSLLTFDSQARVLFPLCPLQEVELPELQIPGGGATMLGAAMHLLLERVQQECRKPVADVEGDYLPLVFVMTDGKPSDQYDLDQATQVVKSIAFGNIVGCAAGPKAKTEPLQAFCDHVVHLETMDSTSFAQFFKWAGEAVAQTSQSNGNSQEALPAPPAELRLDF